METLQLTKLQARYCLEYRTWAIDLAKRHNQKELKHLMSYDKEIQEINGKIYMIKTPSNLTNTKFYYLLENHTVTKILINDQEVSEGYLEGFLNDLTDLEQRKVLEDFYVGNIENYLEKRCGHPITLKKFITNKNGKYQLDLYTDDLLSETGICKAMLKHIYIESRNNGFCIDKETGEQRLSYMRFYFRYEHQDGGSNGYEIGVIRQNKNGDLEGYNYETEKYEVI